MKVRFWFLFFGWDGVCDQLRELKPLRFVAQLTNHPDFPVAGRRGRLFLSGGKDKSGKCHLEASTKEIWKMPLRRGWELAERRFKDPAKILKRALFKRKERGGGRDRAPSGLIP